MCTKQWISKSVIIGIVAVLCVPFSVSSAIQATYYVDPAKGSDNYPGTLSQPFKTITRARDAVRRINVKITGDISVYLRGGTYFISSPIEFNSRDTGTSGHPIIYCNYPGETPIISGGKLVTGWTLYDPRENIYQAKNVAFNFRQLYVNGVKAIRARTPNPGDFFRTTGYDLNGKNIEVENSKVANWNNISKVEMHLLTQWADNILRVSSYSSNGEHAAIKFQAPEDVIFRRSYPSLKNNQWYFWENAYEFIDTASEWYLNQSTKILYYKAREGEDMSKACVIAPSVETLMKIQGDSLGSTIHHVNFEGITFAHSTYLRPSDSGNLILQAGQYSLSTTNTINDPSTEYIGRPASGLYVENADYIRFERNFFTQMGATALDFYSGTHNSTIVGNIFKDISGNGISIAKFVQNGTTSDVVPYNPVDQREICSSDSISNNLISSIGTDFFGSCGIACGYPQNIRIDHNEVSYCPYTGINVGFGFTSKNNAMRNNVVVYNDIHHVMQILCDGAAIYTLSYQPNSQISYNYIHDFNKSLWAEYGIASIFLDEQTTGYTVNNNVRVNVPPIWYNGTIDFNISRDNEYVDSTVIRNAGREQAYRDLNADIPLVIDYQTRETSTKSLSGGKNEYEPNCIVLGSTIRFFIKDVVSVSIIDMKGRTILEEKCPDKSINFKDYSITRGLYIIRLHFFNNTYRTQKVRFL